MDPSRGYVKCAELWLCSDVWWNARSYGQFWFTKHIQDRKECGDWYPLRSIRCAWANEGMSERCQCLQKNTGIEFEWNNQTEETRMDTGRMQPSASERKPQTSGSAPLQRDWKTRENDWSITTTVRIIITNGHHHSRPKYTAIFRSRHSSV